jgi:hypothetical protein
MQPTDRPLYNPSKYSKPASMLGVSLGQHRFNSSPSQLAPMLLRIISPVSLRSLGSLSRPSHFAFDCRDRIYKRQQLRHVVRIGTGQDRRKRDASRLCNHVMFAPRFRLIGRVWPSFGPPFKALT